MTSVSPIRHLACVVAFALLGNMATAGGLAVKRDQQVVPKSILPVISISFGTHGIGMPIDSVTVRDISTCKSRKFIVAKSFGNSKPDYLTAVAGETVWCLVTLHLDAGDYALEEIEYTGGKNDSHNYTFNFAQASMSKFTFHVVSGAVNYLGSIEFTAAWNPWVYHPSPNVLDNSELRKEFPACIQIQDNAERDRKWASDQIPGLRDLPAVLSSITAAPAMQPGAAAAAGARQADINAGNEKAKTGDYVGAIADFDRVLKLDPQSVPALLGRAAAKDKRGDAAGSAADFDQAIAIDPKNAFAYVVRAESRLTRGDLEGSLADTRRALELDANLKPGLMNSAIAKRTSGDLDGAIADLDRIIMLFPGDTAAFYNRGQAKRDRGDLEGALADFELAIEAYPTNSFAYRAIGSLKESVGDFPAAQQAYLRSINAEPMRADYVRFFLALVLRRQHLDEAPAGLAKAVHSWPDGWTKTVGRFLLGKITESALMHAAESGDPKTVSDQRCEAYYYAGMVRLLNKDRATSKTYFERCLETGARSFTEYRQARIELDRLDPPPATHAP